MESREYWAKYAPLSGEELGRVLGIDGGSARRKIREAKALYGSTLDWYDPVLPENNKVLKGIGIFDLHYPHQTTRLWKNILKFTADFDPDIFAFGGDNLNIDALDHWALDRGKRRTMEGKRLKQEYTGFVRDVHEPLEAVLRPDCRRIWHKGNHEDWVEQYIDQHPEVEGFFEIPNNIPLARDNWELYEYGVTSQVGKLRIMHGEYINKYNAATTVQTYGTSIIYGHGHTFQAFTMTTPHNADSHSAVQIPCACDLNPHYRLNKPNAWINGFCVFYIQPNGRWNLYPILAFDGTFVGPNGVLYE